MILRWLRQRPVEKNIIDGSSSTRGRRRRGGGGGEGSTLSLIGQIDFFAPGLKAVTADASGVVRAKVSRGRHHRFFSYDSYNCEFASTKV